MSMLSRVGQPRALMLISVALVLAGVLSSVASHGPTRSASSPTQFAPTELGASPGGAWFRDIAQEAGIAFQMRFDTERDFDLLASVGTGCAFLDYDNDGNLDILLIGPKLALYKGDGHGHFQDVTHATGLDRVKGRFVGCAVGDFNNDGYEDIYLSAYHGGAMLYNHGGRYFEDVTRKLGLTPQPLGNSCAVADFDGDGRLDLYVTNYVAYDHERFLKKTGMYSKDHRPLWPDEIPGLTGVLFKNCGDHFEDVTHAWGAERPTVHGRAMAADAADIDDARRPALFIGNDSGQPQDLLLLQKGRFRNIAAKAGVAFDGRHNAFSGMGIDFGDYDNDGRLDVFVTTWKNDTKLLFHNDGHAAFTDRSVETMVQGWTYANTAWGAKFIDYDNSGWLDLVIANGASDNKPPDYNPKTERFKQPVQILRNQQGAAFEDVTATSGPDLQRPILGRGLAIGDFDNDGRMDVLVMDADGRPLLLHNETPHAGHWLLCKLVGTKSNRDGIGAMLTFEANGRRYLRRCSTGGSYLSASDKRVHCGLADATQATITVRWPSGHTDIYRDVKADRVVTLVEGTSQQRYGASKL